MTFTIRDLTAGDEARWRELWRGYLTFYQSEIPPAVTDATWGRLLDETEADMFSLLACDGGEGGDGRVIGMANCVLHSNTWTDKPVCYLEDLFVDPAARNRGAARALIEAVHERGRTQSWHRVYWRTRENNTTARSLYGKIGDLTDWVVYENSL